MLKVDALSLRKAGADNVAVMDEDLVSKGVEVTLDDTDASFEAITCDW